jgi:hypothetical protein
MPVPRIKAMKKSHLRDATQPITIHITKCDIRRAAAAKKRNLKPQENCVIAQAWLRQPNILKALITRETARVWFQQKKIIVSRRYILSPEARVTVMGWDKYGASITESLTFNPPKGVRTLRHLRSKKAADAREASRKRCAGKPRRPYQRVEHNLRWGLGRHTSIA